MYVGYSKEHEALRDELREYYERILTPEVEEDLRKGEGVGETSKRIWKQMAADGWCTDRDRPPLSRPADYGRRSRPAEPGQSGPLRRAARGRAAP